MKTEAVHFVGPRKVELREIEVGDPKPTEVQVLCKANGISAADVALFTEADKRPYPFVGGQEGVGQVLRVGSDVKTIQPGEYVTCDRWQKLQNVEANRASKIPGEPDDAALWLVAPVSDLLNLVHHAEIRPGDRVMILGSDFLGLLLTQVLARYPVYELAVADNRARNLGLAAQFGATETVNTATADGKARLELLQKNPFDLVIEASGQPQTLELGAQLTRTGGSYCLVAPQRGPQQVNLGAWQFKGINVSATPSPHEGHGCRGSLDRAVRCMWRGLVDLKPLVTHRHKVGDAQAALEQAAKGADDFIKGVLTF